MTTPRRRRNKDSYDAAVRALAGLTQEMANLRKFMHPPYLDYVNQLGKTQVRLQQLEVGQAWMSSMKDSVAHLIDISNSSKHIHDMFNQTGAALVSIDQLHESWFTRVGDITNYQSQLDAYAKLYLCDTSLHLAATQNFLTRIDFDLLKSQYYLPLSTFSAMEQSLFDTTASYRTLIESIPDISAVVQMPSFVLPGATFELFTLSYALDVLLPSDEPEETSEETEISDLAEDYLEVLYFVELLERVNPKLVPIYLGARKVLYGNDPDRKRHVLVSLRELWNWTIRELAPQQEAFDWISEHGITDGLDPNNRPSRIGKVCFISREIDSHPLTNFVVNTAQSSTALHRLYNRVHDLEPGLNEHQLRAVYYKTVSELSYLIQISLVATRH